MKNKFFIALTVSGLVLMAMFSCKKNNDVVDPHAVVKLDNELRFQNGGLPTVKNDSSTNLIYRDKGLLFSSTKQKFGWSTPDGKTFFFLEFEGDPAVVGKKDNATLYIRSSGGTPVRVSCEKAEVVKVEVDKVWIIYQETTGKPQGEIVQKL